MTPHITWWRIRRYKPFGAEDNPTVQGYPILTNWIQGTDIEYTPGRLRRRVRALGHYVYPMSVYRLLGKRP